MSPFSLRVGEIIFLPEQEVTIEVLDVEEDRVRLGITGPFLHKPAGQDFLNYREQVIFLELAG